MSAHERSISPSTSSEIDIPSDASARTYKHVLRNAQRTKNRLYVQLATKEKELADITNQDMDRAAGPSTDDDPRLDRNSKNIYLVNKEQRKEVQKCARKFTYMSTFWLRPSDTQVFKLDIDPYFNPKNRFLSAEEQQQAILAEIRADIPQKWHDEMSNPAFINQFLHDMGQQRSNACRRMCEAGLLILDCSNEVFHDKRQLVNTYQELIGFVINEEGVKSCNTLAPILYQDNPNQTDPKWTIFRRPMLMKTYSALVRGLNSIQGLSEGQVTKIDGYHSTRESQWKIQSITPGAIAMSCILTRFIASDDRVLQPQGSQTGISYQEDYEFYFKYLYKGLHEEIPSVVDIFKTWNRIFYPKSLEVSSNVMQNVPENLNNLLNDLEAEGVEARRALQEADLNAEQSSTATNRSSTTGPRMVSVVLSCRLLRLTVADLTQSPLSTGIPQSASTTVVSRMQSHQSSPLTETGVGSDSDHHRVSRAKGRGIAKTTRKRTQTTKRKAAQTLESDDASDKENTAPPPSKRSRRRNQPRRC